MAVMVVLIVPASPAVGYWWVLKRIYCLQMHIVFSRYECDPTALQFMLQVLQRSHVADLVEVQLDPRTI